MDITIYNSRGRLRAVVSPNDSSTQVKEIQGDNVLNLSFTHYDYIALDVNDYVDFLGERYYLMDKSLPIQKSSIEWDYDLKFYAVESLLKRFLVLETTDGNIEPEFTLTATPHEHVAMIVKCINNGMGKITDWKVGDVEGADNIVIDYEGKYCDEALKEIAEKVGNQAEWWIDGQTINISRCEYGESIGLGYAQGLTNLERDTTGTDKFYTRLFPIGSSRNIDPEEYGYNRLMLPYGKKFIEYNADEYGIFDHYEKDAFSNIYPRRIGTVSRVRKEDTKDKEGNPMSIYYFKDDALSFNPNDYELPGEVKHISFQNGELAGLGTSEDHYFEVNFDNSTREFEIINIYPTEDGGQLPGGMLIPRIGDEYILWNIKMPKEYYRRAEEELLEAVHQYNKDHWQDISVYKGQTDHVWLEEKKCELYVGRRVNLLSKEYFPKEGFRKSRITKIIRQVNLPSCMDVEISDALHSGVLQRVSGKMTALRSYTKKNIENNTLPNIIRTYDRTKPTDNNIFSARRTYKEFLNKNKADRAKELITFEKGLRFGDNFNVDSHGNAKLNDIEADSIHSAGEFVDGLLGGGYRLCMDEDGKACMTLDKLTVRETMVVMELLMEKVRAVGGQLVVSAASGKVKSVEENEDSYKLCFENGNTFVVGDLLRCSVWTAGVKRDYWTEVKNVEDEKIVVSKTETAAVPMVGDDCVLMGNTLDADRQNLILISATEDGEPRVDVLSGVHTTNFDGCLRARLGKLDDIHNDLFPQDSQPHGDGLYADNAYLKGTFLLSTGEDVKTRFEITEGKLESAMAAVRNDFVEDKGYLSNPSFSRGMADWDTANEAVFFLVGNRWVWVNNNVLSDKGDTASLADDKGRKVVRIQHRYIRQLNCNLKSKPSFEKKDGKWQPVPVYLSFYYRCTEAGNLRVMFENIDKTGWDNFNDFYAECHLEKSDEYRQFTCSGLWNGTGDFRLEFDGDIYLYMLVLTTDRVESLTYKYKTLFEQSERLVKLSAAVYDKDENALRETGLFVKPEGSGIYAQDKEGNVALVGAMIEEDGKSKIKLLADDIRLEGFVTANGHFKIKKDGSMQTKKAIIENSSLRDVLISGAIRTPFRTGYYKLTEDGPISASTYGLQNNNNVVIPGAEGGWNQYIKIPWTDEYNGFRAVVMNDDYDSEKTGGTWTVEAEENKYFYENGWEHKKLKIPPYSGVEMLGFGDNKGFKGWIILNRIYRKKNHRGFQNYTMFSGRVDKNGRLHELKTYNGENITSRRNDTGNYTISFEESFSDIKNYMVMLTGYSEEGRHHYAALTSKKTDSFDVYTGDDDSANDGGFYFMVINTSNAY